MKTSPRQSSILALCAAFGLSALASSAFAADATWNNTSSGAWTTGANWSPAAAPGATTGTTNADTATFNTLGSPIITVPNSENIANLTFSTLSGVNSYLFTTSTAILLSAGGTVQTSSGYTGAAAFNMPINLQGNATFSANGLITSGINFNGVATAAASTLTLTGSNTGLFNAVQGVISGSGAVSKTGAGTWFLYGANTYTGGTTLNGGTVIVNNAASIGSSGTITVAGNSTIRTNVALTDPSARISISDGATLTFDTNNAAQTWAGVLTNSGASNTAGLTKTGLGVLTIQPAVGVVQSWKGTTTVNMGTLNITGASQTAGFSNLINSSSALVLGGGNIGFVGKNGFTNSQTFNGTTLNAGISGFIPGATSGTNTFDFGTITRNSGALLDVVTAGGYTIKAGSTANDAGGLVKGVIFSGGDFTTVSGGNLVATSYTTQNAAGSWTSGTANYVTGGAVTGSVGTATINALKFNNASNQNVTITGTLAVNDGILFGNTTGANNSQISGGTLTGPSGGGDLIIVNNNASATVFGRSTITSTIADNGGVTNLILSNRSNQSTTSSNLYIAGNNTYTGNTYVGGGANNQAGSFATVIGGAAGARIGSAGATVFVNGGTGGTSNILRIGNGDATGDVLGTIQIDNGTLALNRTDTNTLSATVSGFAGGGYITLANTGNTTVNLASGNNTFQTLQTVAAGTLNLAGSGSVNTFISTGPFASSATGGFNAGSTVNFNSGTYIFGSTGNSGSNRTGTWNVQGADVVVMGARYWNSGGGNVTVSSGSLRFQGGTTITAGEQQGGGISNIFNVSGTGLLDVAIGGGATIGSKAGGQGNGGSTQDTTTFNTINQSGGVVQVGVTPNLNSIATTATLTIGNGASQNRASYNLSGGTLRVAGAIAGVASTATTGQMSFTSGSNVAGIAANQEHYIGEVLSGAAAIAAGVNGFTITAIGANFTATLSGNATSTQAAAAVTGTQPTANLYRVFNWTGGTLTTSAINMTNLGGGDATNAYTVGSTGTLYQGGTGIMSPGDLFQGITYTGKTAITGNYTIDSGTVAIGIGGTTAATVFHNTSTGTYDNISVSGATVLGGRLNVALNNSYTPPSDVTTLYNIVVGSASGVTGAFTNQQVATSGNSRVVLADGLSSFLIANNNTASAATTGGLTSVGARTVALGGYQATNTYSGAGTAWDTASAGAWTNFDPGATATPATQASGAIAQFADGTASIGAIGVSLNSTRNIQGIQFSSAAGSRAYTISQGGSGAIILDNTANSASATIADTSTSGTANAINVPITLNSNLAASVANAANTLTIGGVISGTGMSLTKTGAGTLALTGANTYTGTTTITAGTLQLGASNVLADNSNIVLNGGSFAEGSGFTETVGTLSLLANSTIDLGSASSLLAFTDSSALNWGSSTLSITGSFMSGSSLKFGTSTGGLTSGQLALISITGYNMISLDSSGYLIATAIPEPSAFAALAGALVLVGAVVYRRRRS